jgi:hypothetical protein
VPASSPSSAPTRRQRRSPGCVAHGVFSAASRRSRMKRTPTLEFLYDDTLDRAMRVEELLDDD